MRANQGSPKNDDLPFDVDGATFESTSGLPLTTIQRRARGGILAGEWQQSGNTPGIIFDGTTSEKSADGAETPNGGHLRNSR